MMQIQRPRPLLLVILDGFGLSERTGLNAIAAAHTPYFDALTQTHPPIQLDAAGPVVGLPQGQMGNSEVGHLTMGAGRIIQQDLTRIDQAIETGTFFQNTVLCHTILNSIQQNNTLHIFGLLSPGGVHSHEKHIQALIELAASLGVKKLVVHAFLDGRDVPPRSATDSLQALETCLQKNACGQIGSLMGRYYAMDRDQRWERTEMAYRLLTEGVSSFEAPTAQQALAMAYSRGEDDEFVKPTLIRKENFLPIQNNDTVIFMNFRADRARQLSRAFLSANFSGFKRNQHPLLQAFVTLTEYATDIPSQIAFKAVAHTHILGEVIAAHHLKQLRIAETEKYAHVTFFFNGGEEKPFPGEVRELIPSPKVATYDLKPAMSAHELTDALIKHIKSKNFDVIICNYANADMVGHTGNFEATIKAIETLDQCLSRVDAALQTLGGEMLITADHGNAECMFDENTQQPHTAHTSDPVPLFYVGRRAAFRTDLNRMPTLSDIAPTILYLLGIEKPCEMTGVSVLD